MAEAGSKDAFGHAQLGGVGPLIATLVKDKLSYKYHWAVADYLQRAARHIASKTDLDHSYAVGKAAVLLALAGNNAVMPAIVRVSDKPYRWKIAPVPLTKVANVEKMLPRDYIAADGYGITAKARAYLSRSSAARISRRSRTACRGMCASRTSRCRRSSGRNSRSDRRSSPPVGGIRPASGSTSSAPKWHNSVFRRRRSGNPVGSSDAVAVEIALGCRPCGAPRSTGRSQAPTPGFHHGCLFAIHRD
jgi:hypothetical protein